MRSFFIDRVNLLFLIQEYSIPFSNSHYLIDKIIVVCVTTPLLHYLLFKYRWRRQSRRRAVRACRRLVKIYPSFSFRQVEN